MKPTVLLKVLATALFSASIGNAAIIETIAAPNSGSLTANNRFYSSLGSAIDSGTVYISFTMSSDVVANFYAFELWNGERADGNDNNRRLKLGNEGGTHGFGIAGSFGALSSAPAADESFNYIIKLDFDTVGSADTATAFINPVGLEAANTSNRTIAATGDIISFDRIAFAAYIGGATLNYSDITIADDWGSAISAIPEPSSTAALLGLGAIALVLRRRKM